MHNQENNNESEHSEMEEGMDMGYLDEMISMLEEYIENPKLVTKETLTDLRDKLIEMKESMGDKMESQKSDSFNSKDNSYHEKMKGKKPLSAIIVNVRRMK